MLVGVRRPKLVWLIPWMLDSDGARLTAPRACVCRKGGAAAAAAARASCPGVDRASSGAVMSSPSDASVALVGRLIDRVTPAEARCTGDTGGRLVGHTLRSST